MKFVRVKDAEIIYGILKGDRVFPLKVHGIMILLFRKKVLTRCKDSFALEQ